MQFTHLGMIVPKQVSTGQSLTNSVNAFSTSSKTQVWQGFAGLLLTSNTATFTVSQQCSVDGTNWYDPVDSSGNPLGVIQTGFSASSAFIQFNPVIAKHIRLKYVPTVSGVVTAVLLILE